MFALCLVPLGQLAWRALHHNLTANPIEYITHQTGDWTLIFIVITLAVTPARKLLRLPELIRFRRMLGLFAFFYGLLHFSTWIGLDKFFDWTDMLHDVRKRPFITAGFTGFRADDSARLDLHGRMDSPPGRQALAGIAPADLRYRHRRRGALLLAGEVGRAQAAVLRRTADASSRFAGTILAGCSAREGCLQNAGIRIDHRRDVVTGWV